ncbi:Vac7 protein [Pichia kluyveri]|uniref:Vac7 protein n=1 Tax=Pichia kluyveri TaxID=36015 RepID=A0AAV5R938_PICKL|nr:Vac7 protein [Pichia kluyveri]
MPTDKKNSKASSELPKDSAHIQATPAMMSVVEEQCDDDSSVLHLSQVPADTPLNNIADDKVLLVPLNNHTTAVKSITQKLDDSDKENLLELQAQTQAQTQAQPQKLMNSIPFIVEESKTPSLNLNLSERIDSINKKLLDPVAVTNKNINEMKLKKATNPSISSLRTMSLQGNNHGTVSSTSTTLTKDSSRAEYFYTKVHDAMKNDTNQNNHATENFVYGLNTSTPLSEQPSDAANIENSIASKDTKKNKLYNTVDSTHNRENTGTIDTTKAKEKLQNVFNFEPESPTSKKIIDETFDVKSRSSLGSRKSSKKRSMRNFSDIPEIQPMSKIDNDDKSVNKLRQITSRLFECKSNQPRRYSSINDDYTNTDSFEEDLEYYEPSLTHMVYNNDTLIPNGNSYEDNEYNNHPNNRNSYDPLYNGQNHNTNNNDHFDDGELQSFFSMNYNDNSVNSQKHDYHGKPNHNVLNVQDYGSIPGDKRKMVWKRSDIYSSPHDFTPHRVKRLRTIKNICYSASIIILMLLIGFISGFVLATNTELQDLEVVDVNNMLVSQEEIVFDMVFSAFNPGLISITVDNTQLDIFAKTQYVYSSDGPEGQYETILLGSIETLDIPLYFQGGFLNRRKDDSTTQLKIINPCSNKGNDDDDDDNDGGDGGDHNGDDDNDKKKKKKKGNGNGNGKSESESKSKDKHEELVNNSFGKFSPPDERWLNISRHPFDLIIRGVMMYRLPFSSENHTISISYTAYVDPRDDLIV